jgi:hypothetical protein
MNATAESQARLSLARNLRIFTAMKQTPRAAGTPGTESPANSREAPDRHAGQTFTETCRKVAGIEVASAFGLVFWLVNRAVSSWCSSSVRPFASAAA